MEASKTDSQKAFLVCLLLAVGIWFVYGPTVRYGFVNYDDNEYVYENSAVQGGLSFKNVAWAFTHYVSDHWHPLTVLTLMADWSLHGARAGGYHLTNLFLHATAAILLFLVLREMTGALWPAACVAALFAVHPMHVQSVAWISERKDVLSAIFFALILGAYLRYVRVSSLSRYLAVAFCFALGLMSKPTLVTLPFVLLLLDYWPLNRFAPPALENRKSKIGNTAHLLFEKLPLLLLSLLSSFVTYRAVPPVIMLPGQPGQPDFFPRLCNAVDSYAAYVCRMFYPIHLAIFYPFPEKIYSSKVAASAILLVAVTAAVLFWRKSRPWLPVGWFWFLGMLVPMIGIVSPGGKARADRYFYLSGIGLYILIVWTAAAFLQTRSRRLQISAWIAAAALLAMLMADSRIQTDYWQNSVTLWTHALDCTSNNVVAEADLSNALLQNGNVDEAIRHLKMVVGILPHAAESYCNLGNALMKKKQPDQAAAQFREALKLRPDFPPAHAGLGDALLQLGSVDEAVSHLKTVEEFRPGAAEPAYNLGNALLADGRVEEAITEYRKALKLDAGFAPVHNNLGNALLRKGDIDEALVQYEQAVLAKPDYREAHFNLAGLLLSKGRLAAAVKQYNRVLEIDPLTADAANNLAWILATSTDANTRNGSEAVRWAENAVRLSGGEDPEILGTLAAAYAESGRFPEAIKTGEHALGLADDASKTAAAEALRGQLKCYRAGAPYRDTTQTESR